MSGSTITGTITHTVKLGAAGAKSPLAVSSTGDIAPAAYGTAGIFGPASLLGASIYNQGKVSGASGGDTADGGIGVNLAAATMLNNTGIISGGSSSTEFNYSGGAGVDLRAGGTIINSGSINGGYGGYGNGSGGAGVVLADATLINSGTITAGGGGYTFEGVAGNGGIGVNLLIDGSVTNSGEILGGRGGYGYRGSDNGGDGVLLHAGLLSNAGTIRGGVSGFTYVGYPGQSGLGVQLLDTASLTNTGVITGGAGASTHFDGGAGAVGVAVQLGTVTNLGTISGGAGGIGSEEFGGRGGTGVMVNGGTLITSGTISGGPPGNYRKAGDAVAFGSAGGTLVIDPGAIFNGTVVANTAGHAALVLGGTAAGTLTGIGGQIIGFASLGINQGANWMIAGANTIGTVSSLSDNGTLLVTGSLNDAGAASIGASGVLGVTAAGIFLVSSLTLEGGTLGGGTHATVAVGNTLMDVAPGMITIEAGATVAGFGSISDEGIINDGAITAQGGALTLAGPVSGTGTATIASGAELIAKESLSDNTVVFAGAGKLALGTAASVTSTLSGFSNGDIIDLQKQLATSLSYSGGTLTVYDNQAAVATLTLAGTYTSANFGLEDDQHGGTDIVFLPQADMLASFAPLAHATSFDWNRPASASVAVMHADLIIAPHELWPLSLHST